MSNPDESYKNDTRLSLLLGTWTSQSNVVLLGNKLSGNFIVHFMVDSMKGNRCYLDGCDEINNQVCLKPRDYKDDNKCSKMEESISDWSDVVAFFNFGGRVDAGFPFNIHGENDSGGWIGPINIIMARNFTDNEYLTDANRNTRKVVDRYETRYVISPSSRYLHNPGGDLFGSQEDFDNFFGYNALNTTVFEQKNNPFSWENPDPYADYLGTCDNGDVQPILPLFQFTFVEDHNTPTGEVIETRLNYKVLTVPNPNNALYKVFPMLKKEGLPISGPYCYGDDPHRGWTYDFSYDSSAKKHPYINLDHACIEGLPCLPKAAEFSVTEPVIEIHEKAGDTKVNVGPVLALSICSAVLAVLSMVLIYRNWKFRKAERVICVEVSELGSSLVEPTLELEEPQNGLSQPFLNYNRGGMLIQEDVI